MKKTIYNFKKDVLDFFIKDFPFNEYKIKYKIIINYNLFKNDDHILIIKYKKKKAIFYNEMKKYFTYFDFAFEDDLCNDDKDLIYYKYIKENPEHLETIVKFFVKSDVEDQNQLLENLHEGIVPRKWKCYTTMK